MSVAGNALVWTAVFFVGAFAAIYVVFIADRIRSSMLGKP